MLRILKYNVSLVLTILLCGTFLLSFLILTSSAVLADDIVSDVSVSVPVSCTMTSTVDSAHTASINNGTYEDDIGLTTLKVVCNESSGFSIYAIGYSNEEYGNNKLLATVAGELMPTYDIVTGTNEGGSVSNWAMKLNPVTTGSYIPTIVNSYDDYNNVPATYTKVATFNSTTDATIGASVQSTYAAYINPEQPAGTYAGKVKYTMVHPASEVPAQPQTTESGKICYYANASDAVGTMGCQSVASSVTLLASNFSRTGYGFAGWSDAFNYETNANAHFYGPSETITLTPADYQSPNNGLSLYAVWIKSKGSLQDSDKIAELCGTGTNSLTIVPIDGTANLTSVSALTDWRDNETYAIAKLADGNCWMIENLRLENTGIDNANGSLAQGYGGQFVGLADPEPAWADDLTTANSLYSTDGADNTINIGTSNATNRFPRYNNLNTPSNPANRPQNPTRNTFAQDSTTVGMYSYGNYYSWAAAIADTSRYDTNNQSITNASICPSGWHLPKGGTSANATNSDFWQLLLGIMGAAPSNDNQYTGNEINSAGKNASVAIRSFPNNFVYSGYVSGGAVRHRGDANGGCAQYWSSTTSSSNWAYYFQLYPNSVNPGTLTHVKNYGRVVRCITSSN